MVFNLGELDFECRLKWFFQPRQVTGMAVADYYTQFCDWKEEMITLSISAEEDDFIDEFIGNLRWDIRSRVVSKWRSFIHKLSDALYNAKWEESMILIEKNLDLNPESKSVLPPMNPHPDGTIGDDTMEEAIAIKRDAWAQHELVPAPIRESVDEDLDGEGTVQGSANGPFKAYDEAATQLQLDVDPSKIGASNGEPTDESTDPSFTCLKSFSGKFCSFSMIKEVECHLLKAGVALINKAEEIFPAKTEAVVVAYQVLDEMTKSESAGMGSSAGVKNIKIAGRSHSSMIQNLEITRHMLDGMPKLFSVGPNADMDGNKDHVLSLNYILQIFDHKSCSLIDDGIIYSFDPGGISLLLLFPLLDFYCIDELLTNKEQPIIQKIVDKMQASGKSDRDDWRTELPREGLGFGVLELLKEEKQKDVAWQGKCSCTVYIGGSEHEGHFSLINEACSMFSHTNPLHMDVFKSVVAMTAALLGSKEKSVEGHICGNMTSGGTESILMAVKASRDYMKAKKGISKPEMIIPVSAHSAYDKAAQYYNIKLWRVPVNKEFQADVKAIKRHINRNTIMIVGSAPGFSHGIIDPIEELGELACNSGICFHVDLCLGGFVLPFARKLGYPVPPYDFSVNGVTSISVDVHKYGLAPKGTSVVLRKHQFVAVTEWSGGLYVSPTVAGVLYILDLGLCAIYSYILEDKDVLKRTGIGVRLALKQDEELNDILTEIDLRYKDEFYIPAKRGNGDHIMSLYIILVKSFLDADFHFKNVFTNAPKNFDNQINRVMEITLEQQLPKMQATGFRKGSMPSVFEYLASFGVIVVDIQTFVWDPGLVWVIQLVPTGVIKVNFQTFVWDPGLVLVSFRFSTLRTRCSFRGGICHDTTFYYYFYMYFRIFVFTYLASYDVIY